MKSDNFVPENPLGGDILQIGAATLSDSQTPSRGETSQLVGSHGGSRSGDLRPVVARRFMRMLRGHDRARMEVLATHPTQAR